MIDLYWHGPFSFISGSPLQLVYDVPEAQGPGLYLWSVELPDGYLINYVGEAGRGGKTLSARIIEGVRYSVGTGENHTSPAIYRLGKRTPQLIPIGDFLRNLSVYGQEMQEVFSIAKAFVAPLSVDTLTRVRVENALIRSLRDYSDQCRNFLSNKKCGPPGTPRLRIRNTSTVAFIGLPAELDE